jgi:hypothetical protein
MSLSVVPVSGYVPLHLPNSFKMFSMLVSSGMACLLVVDGRNLSGARVSSSTLHAYVSNLNTRSKNGAIKNEGIYGPYDCSNSWSRKKTS